MNNYPMLENLDAYTDTKAVIRKSKKRNKYHYLFFTYPDTNSEVSFRHGVVDYFMSELEETQAIISVSLLETKNTRYKVEMAHEPLITSSGTSTLNEVSVCLMLTDESLTLLRLKGLQYEDELDE